MGKKKRKLEKVITNEPQENECLKRRPVNDNGRKRGSKRGSMKKYPHSLQDWYNVCEAFTYHKKKNNNLQQKQFLLSNESGDKFKGTLQELQSFSRYLKQYNKGKLSPP